MRSRKDLRSAIARMAESGNGVVEILLLLDIPHSTVSKALKRFQETGANEDRPGRGRPRTANNTCNQEKVLSRIERNPRTKKNSTRKIAKAIGISRESVRRILRGAGLKARKEVKAHLITEQAKLSGWSGVRG